MFCFVLFFFFQAEDGIRDGHVTGVQTCALPISAAGVPFRTAYAAAAQAVGREDESRMPEKSLAERVSPEIGRASCRERVYMSVGAGALKTKKTTKKDNEAL